LLVYTRDLTPPACRGALLQWLYEQAIPQADFSNFFHDRDRSKYLGQGFSGQEIRDASVWLLGKGLIEGQRVEKERTLYGLG